MSSTEILSTAHERPELNAESSESSESSEVSARVEAGSEEVQQDVLAALLNELPQVETVAERAPDETNLGAKAQRELDQAIASLVNEAFGHAA